MSWRLIDRGQGEGLARLIETDGQRAVVESNQPFAVGATLIAIHPPSGVEYRIKVRSGRRLNETWFRIEGRFVSLTKPEREGLLAQVASSPGPNDP